MPSSFLPARIAAPEPASILLINDDIPFARDLMDGFNLRGFGTELACSVKVAAKAMETRRFTGFVTDLKIAGESGLTVLDIAKTLNFETKVVVLTAYGSIGAAVTALRLGAADFLVKPSDADDVLDALGMSPKRALTPDKKVTPPNVVRWNHIVTVFEENGRNISDTARRLNMHRRTLQRVLARGKPKNEECGGS